MLVSERVGVIGLGAMGRPMAANLAGSFPLTVWNRTAERATAFATEHEAHVAATPAELGARSDVVITMLETGDQVEEVLLGASGAVGDDPGTRPTLCIDMSTTAPSDTHRIAARLAERGIGLVDAPVTGGPTGAANAALTIIVGGAGADVARATPVLEAMGRLVPVGPSGHGAMVKLLNNVLAAANAVALGEALTLARATGVDPQALLDTIAQGSGGSAVAKVAGPVMVSGDHQLRFRLRHMLKDVGYAADEAAAAGVGFPAADHVRETLESAVALGLGDQDFTTVIRAIEAAARPPA